MKLMRLKPLQDMLHYSSSSNYLQLKHQCKNSSHIWRGMRVQRSVHSFVWVAKATHIKVQWCHLHQSPPMTVLQCTFNLVAPPYFRSTELVESKAFQVPTRVAETKRSGVLQKMKEGTNLLRTEGQGDVDVCGGWDAAPKPGGLQIREREKPRRADRMLCSFGDRERRGDRQPSQETRKGVN